MTVNEYIQAIKPTIDHPYSIPTDAKKGAVIVETRKIENFGLIVKNHLHFLPKGWGLTVCHSYENESFVEEELKDIIGVHWMVVGSDKMDASRYNQLLTSNHFWNLIPYDKVLVFQSDSLLLRHGLDMFQLFDYCGAPWLHRGMPSKGGNGGLSIRSKANTLDTIRTYHYNNQAHGNEDVFYSLNMQGSKNDKEMGKKFSVETMYYPTPIGCHAMEKHLTKEQVSEILTKSIAEL